MMSEDSKKNDRRNAKDQRKPRQRHQQAKVDKRSVNHEESKSDPKVIVPPQNPPVYESPPPEFYKNLKRETDEILKITEENDKYKKKEIQSNWSKYEVPLESYDEIDDQENLGADFEKVLEASLSSGGHFQFKHEKAWDMNTGPSQYDKYFEIDMEDLNIAVCTIPFSERNNIEEDLFSESDILTMKNRATRYKQKYFNDKSYSTPETVVQDKILNSLRDGTKSNDSIVKDTIETKIKSETENRDLPMTKDKSAEADINLELKYGSSTGDIDKFVTQNNPEETKELKQSEETDSFDEIIAHDDFIFRNTEKNKSIDNSEFSDTITVSQGELNKTPALITRTAINESKAKEPTQSRVTTAIEIKTVEDPTVAESPVEKKNQVFESPEDLEKWLDDYLDG